MSRVVVVGASAGGVEALSRLVSGLPGDIAAPLLVVMHVSASSPSALPGILTRAGDVPARHAADGERLCDGVVYVAPPDHHLLLERDVVRVLRGPRENGHRPAIDPLFRSAARWYGDRAVGVVLSGVLDDGSSGLRVLKDCGGTTVVQDPADALYDSMPRNAIAATAVDHVVAVADMGPLLAKLAGELAAAPRQERTMADRVDTELALATMSTGDPAEGQDLAPASHFSCPDCHGVLNEIAEAGAVRFRCRVGHAWSPESLLAAQTDGLENALWAALRALEEKGSLSRRLAERAGTVNAPHSAQRFSDQAEDALRAADSIRALLARSAALTSPGGERHDAEA